MYSVVHSPSVEVLIVLAHWCIALQAQHVCSISYGAVLDCTGKCTSVVFSAETIQVS